MKGMRAFTKRTVQNAENARKPKTRCNPHILPTKIQTYRTQKTPKSKTSTLTVVSLLSEGQAWAYDGLVSRTMQGS